jgi:hypothetical protein
MNAFESVRSGDRLDGRVHRELVYAAGAETIHAGVVPNVRARAAVAAELDIIKVRGLECG